MEDKRHETIKTGVTGLWATHDKALEEVGEHMLKGAPKSVRFVLKKLPGAPGFAYDIGQVVAAKTLREKLRAAAGAAGGMVGGSALGAATGPLGAGLGAMVGEKAAETIFDAGADYYDHHHDQIQRQLEDTKAWMRQRESDVARKAGRLTHAFDNGLPPYNAPLGR